MVDNIYSYEPDYVVPPGEILLDALEERSMTQTDLAKKMGLPRKAISNLIHADQPLTDTIAMKLESVLGISATFWLNLERQYRDGLERIKAAHSLTYYTD